MCLARLSLLEKKTHNKGSIFCYYHFVIDPRNECGGGSMLKLYYKRSFLPHNAILDDDEKGT